jgi:endonuclease/exonuclease/phosphatase (EEP) superfamily protein YafD
MAAERPVAVPARRRPSLLGGLVTLTAWLYLAAVAGVGLAMALVAERWWVTAGLLYLPRLAFLLPALLLVPLALLLHRPGAFFVTLLAAGGVAIWLLGLEVGFPREPSPGAKPLRLLSCNVWYAHRGADAIAREVETAAPDVVVFQAANPRLADQVRAWRPGWQVRLDGEFLLATALPVLAADVPPRSDAYVRYTLSAPGGPLELINVHPVSPRPGLEGVRGQGFRTVLREGVPDDAPDRLESNVATRERQVRGIAEVAGRASHPVVIAGDTNLPGLSVIYRRYLGGFQDGFAEVGFGYGYTFPANKRLRWMRIDRVLAGPGVRFLRFRVGGTAASDHSPVIADLELAPGS